MIPFSSSHRRVLVLAALVFFVSSVYLCTTRLFAMSFTRDGANNGHSSGGHTNVGTNHDDKKLPADFKLTHADLPMSYGDFDRPVIDGLKNLLGHIPEDAVPTVENERRLIIVGDIHGMDTALDALLKKVDFNASTDHLIATGDMVNKGPDSSDVVQRLMNMRASAVRGNHEDRVLLSRAEIDTQYGVSAQLDNTQVQGRKGQLSDLVTARTLTQQQVDWLTRLPVILSVEELNIHIVHAGLMPGIAVEKQDPWAVMNMRTLVYPREKLREKEGEQPLRRRDDINGVEETSEVPPSVDQGTPTMDDDEDEDAPGSALNGQPRDGPLGGNDEEDEIDDSAISFDRSVAIPSAGSDGQAWSEAWDRYQKRLHKHERYTVIYGHDARHGYKEAKYAFGLDSGCVKGDALTALILTAREGGGFRHLTSQVSCNKS